MNRLDRWRVLEGGRDKKKKVVSFNFHTRLLLILPWGKVN